MPATGGTPTPLTQPRREAGEIGHDSPQVLDDGRTILFTLARADGTVPALLNVASGGWRAIQGINSDFARYAPNGHLLYRKGEGVFAVAVLLASGTTTGTPQALFDGAFAGQGAPIAISADGTLAYLPSSIDTGVEGKISIVNRSGAITAVVDDKVVRLIPNATSQLRFSFDGKTMVAQIQTAPNTSDLWIYDLGRGARTKLTDQGPINSGPIWSPDGKQVAFNSTRQPAGIYLQSIHAPGAATLLLKRGPGSQAPGAWSPDRRTLVLVENNPRTGGDLWTLTLDGKASPLLATPAQEGVPRLPPDGQWLAYESDTAGRADVYVAPFPSLSSPQLVSIDGGTSPRWAGEREIVYRRGRQVLSVTVAPGETLTLGRPTVLFEVNDVPENTHRLDFNGRFIVGHESSGMHLTGVSKCLDSVAFAPNSVERPREQPLRFCLRM